MGDAQSKRKTTEVPVGPVELFESARELLRDALATLEDVEPDDADEAVGQASVLAARATDMLEKSKRLRAEERATMRFDKSEG